MSQLPPAGPAWRGPAGSSGPPPPQGQWGPPPWAQPPAWTPGWGQPGWGQPAWPPARPAYQFSPARLLATVMVAAVIAGVVLGGIVLDAAIAAPSAGTVNVGGSVYVTAAPGWVLDTPQGDTSEGIELRKVSAIFYAQVVSTSYSGSSASLLPEQRQSLDDQTAQINYGDERTLTISGHDTTLVVFQATVVSDQGSGIVDGELVCMVVENSAVVFLVAAQQGHLDLVIDDVDSMLASVSAHP